MILVVGASGQLGTNVVRELLARGKPVRAMVRSEAAARQFEAMGCESYIGDITRLGEAKGPFPNVTAVISTANSAMPVRAGDSIRSVDVDGHRNLVAAARELGICGQFIFTSVVAASSRSSVPLFRAKRATEKLIEASGLGYTIFRFPAFLDVWVPMMGLGRIAASLENATVLRDFNFARSHFARIKDSVERDGVIHFAGNGRNRLACICVEDCARLIAQSVDHPECHNRTLQITGPQPISAEEIAEIVERILGGKLKRKKTPAWVFSLLFLAFRGNAAAANLMAINRFAATGTTAVAGQQIARMLGVDLKPPEQWLRERLASPAVRP
jgi:uncharacterized protein YbjT (DUF2867 family)